MTDWLGTTTFELDLLHQITAATDHKGNRVEYTYDGVGNQTSIVYPDATTATYDYDLMGNQTKVTETDGSETEYTYDGMGRVTEMRYPNGWVEYYTYDEMGRILKVEDTHPSEKPAKTQKHRGVKDLAKTAFSVYAVNYIESLRIMYQETNKYFMSLFCEEQ